tara:strand:- start:272 stop:451 length:180 start_codon:yes stop_codon:yes gene_type:complete
LKYIVTGTAGFIGFHTASNLLNKGHSVLGLDSVNSYYDQKLKLDRIKNLKKIPKRESKF